MFVEAAARLEDFKPGATPVLAWLYTVAQRRLVDRARAAAARARDDLRSLDAARLAAVEELGLRGRRGARRRRRARAAAGQAAAGRGA